MMSEFTLGKWKAFDGEKFYVINQAHADDEQGHDYGNGKLIAWAVKWYEGHDWANAELIAAASEMYSILQRVAYGTCDDCSFLVASSKEIIGHIEKRKEAEV